MCVCVCVCVFVFVFVVSLTCKSFDVLRCQMGKIHFLLVSLAQFLRNKFFSILQLFCDLLHDSLGRPVSQFQLSIQASFASLSLVCSSARLIQSKSLRFKFLTDLPISRLNLRLSTKQCLLSPSLSSDGQVNFPFKDLLEVFWVSQRLRKIQFSISFPSRQ